MKSTPTVAGDPIQARCTKCRKNTDHIVITMAEEGPAKVQCGSCNRQHKYRPPTAAQKPAVKRTVNNKEAERKEWETLRPDMDSAKAAEYSMTGDYRVKSLINHPLFGLGIVQRVVGSQKVEVLFEDGKKTMRCG
jgi:hypothetical protein